MSKKLTPLEAFAERKGLTLKELMLDAAEGLIDPIVIPQEGQITVWEKDSTATWGFKHKESRSLKGRECRINHRIIWRNWAVIKPPWFIPLGEAFNLGQKPLLSPNFLIEYVPISNFSFSVQNDENGTRNSIQVEPSDLWIETEREPVKSKDKSKKKDPLGPPEDDALKQLIYRTLKFLIEKKQKHHWITVKFELRHHTNTGEKVTFKEKDKEGAMKPYIIFSDEITIISLEMAESTFQKVLSSYRKLLLPSKPK